MQENRIDSQENRIDSDEIDLIQLFMTIWNEKAIILLFLLIATSVGLVYTQTQEAKYQISTRYKINFHSPFYQQLCNNNTACLESNTINEFIAKQNSTLVTWSLDARKKLLKHETANKLSTNEYQAILNERAEQLSQKMKSQAEFELALIENELNTSLQSTERAATNMINAKRLIHAIENGEKAISFSTISSVNIAKDKLILLLSGFIGLFIGVFFIFIRKAVKMHQAQA